MRYATFWTFIVASSLSATIASAGSVTPEKSDASATTAATLQPPVEQPKKAYVEIYLPSVTELSAAAKASKTADLYAALAALAPIPENETGEGIDFNSIARLLEKLESWSDTAIGIAIYTQDRDGRPRWSMTFDWPLETLVENLRGILNDEAARELLKNVELVEGEGGAYTLELPEMRLACMRSVGERSMIAANDELREPEEMFGRDAIREMIKKSEKEGKPPKKPYLAYCRLNLDSDSGGGSPSLLSGLVGVDAVQYVASINKRGEWNEQFGVSWNPIVGAFLKALFQKVKKPFECPREAYVTAVTHFGASEGLTDQMAGLPMGTIGGKVEGEMLFAATPGSGFLPVPDLFYAYRTTESEDIFEAVREAVKKDTATRADDDLNPAWHEESIDGHTVFWHNPAANGTYGLAPFTFRTVVFVVEPDEDDEDEEDSLLVIAQTSNWADDAVRRWKEVSKDTITLPSASKIHWQARLNWKSAYQLAQPYLGLVSSFVDGASMPPTADALSDSLADSDVQIRINVGGVRVRHIGPMPIGAIYVPAVAAAAISTAADPSSDAAREQVACRNLRVLYHHSKLFKSDYERWPATVAELDGYVDFASHRNLLYLRPRSLTFIEGFTGALLGGKKTKPESTTLDDEPDIDDSLYVIEWSEIDADWRLKFRENEFNSYVTIYIDGEGEIHRVPKPGSQAAPTAAEDEDSKTEETQATDKASEDEKKDEKPKTEKKRKRIVL